MTRAGAGTDRGAAGDPTGEEETYLGRRCFL